MFLFIYLISKTIMEKLTRRPRPVVQLPRSMQAWKEL